MSKRKLPAMAFEHSKGVDWDIPLTVDRKWDPNLRAAESGDSVISIYGDIGETWDGDGWTARRMGGALRRAGEGDVTVNINSRGGDYDEGAAIYNQLREHPGAVNVNVMGLAASAASLIAMAGDTIRVGRVAFLMVHNAWAVAIGNRHDMRAAADWLEPFDSAMASVYAARSGRPESEMAELMDQETWLAGQAAIDAKLADSLLPAEEIETGPEPDPAARHKAAIRTIENALADKGLTRASRRALLADLKHGMPGAADAVTQNADRDLAQIGALIDLLKPPTKE